MFKLLQSQTYRIQIITKSDLSFSKIVTKSDLSYSKSIQWRRLDIQEKGIPQFDSAHLHQMYISWATTSSICCLLTEKSLLGTVSKVEK